MTNIRIQVFHRHPLPAQLRCIKAILIEHNPYFPLSLEAQDDASIIEWIVAMSLHKEWKQNEGEEAIYYWIYDKEDVVGIASIRQYLKAEIYADSGHIGICVKLSARKQGIGYAALKKLLYQAYNTYHIKEILLCCKEENIISRKLCEKVHGVLKQSDCFCHYWIEEKNE